MKVKWLANSKKFALGCAYLALGGLLIYGVVARGGFGKSIAAVKPAGEPAWQTQGKIKVRTGLSQTKVLQGSDGLVYLQIDLEAPESASTQTKQRRPTDFVVVLDHSGSMSDAKKMDYAHRAIESLVNQLRPDDRFALVVFDDTAETTIPLTSVTAENRSKTIQTIKEVQPDGSTNLGAGLLKGMEIITTARQSGNAHRLLLVSDGLANVGVINTEELSKMASQAVNGEYTISTIGVGLDFNENLLSAIADHGTGLFPARVRVLDRLLRGRVSGTRVLAALRGGPGRWIGQLVLERLQRLLGPLDLAFERRDPAPEVVRGAAALAPAAGGGDSGAVGRSAAPVGRCAALAARRFPAATVPAGGCRALTLRRTIPAPGRAGDARRSDVGCGGHATLCLGASLGLLGRQSLLLAQPRVLGPAALVAGQPAVLERDRARADRVEQGAVVGHQQHGAVEGAQRVLERLAGVDVEVVGRLVEDQHVGAGLDEHGQRQPPPLAARRGPRAASRPPRRRTGTGPAASAPCPGVRPVARCAASSAVPVEPSSSACWER